MKMIVITIIKTIMKSSIIFTGLCAAVVLVSAITKPAMAGCGNASDSVTSSLIPAITWVNYPTAEPKEIAIQEVAPPQPAPVVAPEPAPVVAPEPVDEAKMDDVKKGAPRN
jgi:hypothetical protein